VHFVSCSTLPTGSLIATFSPTLPLFECADSAKSHGSCTGRVQTPLRWAVDAAVADRVACFNRHGAERFGYWTTTAFLDSIGDTAHTGAAPEITFYDSITGKALFIAPRGRSFAEFRAESAAHGWPSFRDAEVVWENVRALPGGEMVSIDGTHLGHNLPDARNRYCINLSGIAGRPSVSASPIQDEL
jgi:hypothetical protein